MTTRAFRAGMAGMVLSLLLSLTGCVKMNMEISVVPDGSTHLGQLTHDASRQAVFGKLGLKSPPMGTKSRLPGLHWKRNW